MENVILKTTILTSVAVGFVSCASEQQAPVIKLEQATASLIVKGKETTVPYTLGTFPGDDTPAIREIAAVAMGNYLYERTLISSPEEQLATIRLNVESRTDLDTIGKAELIESMFAAWQNNRNTSEQYLWGTRNGIAWAIFDGGLKDQADHLGQGVFLTLNLQNGACSNSEQATSILGVKVVDETVYIMNGYMRGSEIEPGFVTIYTRTPEGVIDEFTSFKSGPNNTQIPTYPDLNGIPYDTIALVPDKELQEFYAVFDDNVSDLAKACGIAVLGSTNGNRFDKHEVKKVNPPKPKITEVLLKAIEKWIIALGHMEMQRGSQRSQFDPSNDNYLLHASTPDFLPLMHNPRPSVLHRGHQHNRNTVRNAQTRKGK